MKKILLILLLFSSLCYADQMSDARTEGLNLGASYKNSASSIVNEQNKSSTPGYVTDNPQETKYYDGTSTQNDALNQINNSAAGNVMTEGMANRTRVNITGNEDYLSQSKAIQNNPDEVISMMTGTYQECRPLSSTKTEYEARTCDQYDEIDCIDGDKILSISGAETTFNFPYIDVNLSWRDGGGCSKSYSYTNITINDLASIKSFALLSVGWDDVIRIKVNGNIVFSNGNVDAGRCERGTVFNSSPKTDLKPYLVQGENQIELTLGVAGRGFASARYSIDYPKDKICQKFDNCTNLPQNCTFQSTRCLNTNKDNVCDYRQNLYQCSVSTTTSTANIQCGSTSYCTNNQCTTIDQSNNNNDFAKTIAYLSAINKAGKDNNSADNLRIFTGETNSCDRSTILGYNSCCTDNGWGQSVGASCSAEEKRLIDLQSQKLCHFVGSYCAKKTILGSCQTTRKSYCCFNSKISRVIQEQGRAQLGIDWGSGENPECRGFTAQELQSIRFDQINLSEITSDIANSVVNPDPAYLQGKIKQTLETYEQTN